MIELSVIIATYNRAGPLQACLEALCRQTESPMHYEVVVVVDGSTDATTEMLAQFTAPYQLRVCEQSNSGPGAARNHGVEVAAGTYCLFLDDDIIAEPELVAAHLETQQALNDVVVLGHLDLMLPSTADRFARQHAAWWQDHYARLRDGMTPSYRHCYSGNLSVPRAILLELGGFATDLARDEDVELGYRLAKHGLHFVYAAGASGRQEYRKGLPELLTDAEREGRASIKLYQRHPAMLPDIRLGAFGETSARTIILRRILLAANVPLHLLALIRFCPMPRRLVKDWFRFLYDYAYWRGVRRAVPDRQTWHRLIRGPVILMYHALGHTGEPPSRYVVPAHRFVQQMAWLKLARYNVLGLDELLICRREHRLPPARSVVITFDDGYADNREIGYPLLRRHGFKATIFLVTSAIGSTNRWDHAGDLADRAALAWPAIKEMLAGGISLGAHTRTHPRLTDIPTEAVAAEVAGSRADLEHVLGYPIRSFAYPFGKNNAETRGTVEQAGFLGACGIRHGMNSAATDSYALRRVAVHGTDSLLHFALAVALGEKRLLFLRRRAR